MARSLRMIAPFDVLTGNISGTRKLKYNDKMNPAWNAPDGQQYARNYKPRYVGIFRAKTGKTTFIVKEKSATNLNAATRRRMAAMGGTCAMYNENGWRFPLTVLSRAQLLYSELKARDPELSYRKAFFTDLYDGLLNRQEVITIPGMQGYIADIQVGNPWAKNPSVTPMGLSDDEVFNKFFLQLAPNAIKFMVGRLEGHCYAGDSFTTLIASNYNTLDLHVQTQGQYVDFVMKGELYLCYDVEQEGQMVKNSPQGGEQIDSTVNYYLDAVPGESGG